MTTVLAHCSINLMNVAFIFLQLQIFKLMFSVHTHTLQIHSLSPLALIFIADVAIVVCTLKCISPVENHFTCFMFKSYLSFPVSISSQEGNYKYATISLW